MVGIDEDGDEDSDEEDAAAPGDAAATLEAITGASSRLGVVSYEFTQNARSRCYVCHNQGLSANDKAIAQDELKFMCRMKAGQVEKSVHRACVLNGALAARLNTKSLRQSEQFFTASYYLEPADDIKVDLAAAASVFAEALTALTGPSASSGGAGGAASGAASASGPRS